MRSVWRSAQSVVLKARSGVLESGNPVFTSLPSQADRVALCAEQVQARALFLLAIDVQVRVGSEVSI